MVGWQTVVPDAIRSQYVVKFVIAIVAVTLVIAAVGAASYMSIDQTVRADSEERLESTAELQADGIGDWVEAMRVQTVTTSNIDVLRTDEIDEIGGAITEEQARLSVDVRAIHYVDTDDGEVLRSTQGATDGQPLADVDEPWATTDLTDNLPTDEAVWNTPTAYEDDLLEDQVMAFASPVPERDDRVVVLIGTLEYRVDQLHQADGDGSTTIIVDADQNVVLGADDIAFDVDTVDEDDVAGALAGHVHVSESEDFVQAYVPVADTEWVAVSTVPTDDAYAVANEVGLNVLAMIGVSLVTLGAVGVVLGRHTITPLARLRNRAQEMEEGNLGVDLETDRIDEIGRLFDGFDSMRDSLRGQILKAKEAMAEAEEARAETEAINRHLLSKADEYRDVMEACADGDLTHRLDPDSESQAMTDIAYAFNAMVGELEETTAELKSFAGDVAAASQEVTASAEEVRSASQEVTWSVQQISDGADRQNENLKGVSNEMADLSTTTEEIAASSNEVADLAQRTVETGQVGRKAAEDAIEGMIEVRRESKEAVEAIEALQDEMGQVDELIEFISQVANQTNMLALNANIEASRSASEGAGDTDGFAVVASEVKELAEQTKQAAEDIESILERFGEGTDRVGTEVQRTAERVAIQAKSVQNAAKALDQIAAYAQRTNEGVQEISAATESQAATAAETVGKVSRVTDISEETSAESQHVAAAAEEQTASLDEVTDSVSSLAQRAVKLHQSLDRFDTDIDRDGPRDADQKGDDSSPTWNPESAATGEQTTDDPESDSRIFAFDQYGDREEVDTEMKHQVDGGEPTDEW